MVVVSLVFIPGTSDKSMANMGDFQLVSMSRGLVLRVCRFSLESLLMEKPDS